MINSESEKLLTKLSFCVFDLETTGSNQKSDKIIEIGLVKIENLKIVKTKGFLINPEIKIPEFIQKLTGINQESVKDSPIIDTVIDEIVDFMGNSILVAHNISFDIPFFNSVLRRLKKPPLKNKTLCTNLMTRFLMPSLVNSNLNYMCSIFNIPHKKAHKAIDDATASAKLLLIYLNIFLTKGITKVNNLYYPRNRFELDKKHYKRNSDTNLILEDLKKIKTPFSFKIKGEKGSILFILPCLGDSKELEVLKEKIFELPWKLITIKLYGTFLESLILFANLSSKINKESLKDILDLLWTWHILPRSEKSEPGSPLNYSKIGDFVFANHLIPGQFVLYPLNLLSHKSQLILKYPAQRKKLIHHLNQKETKINLKNSIPLREVKNFLEQYLLNASEMNDYFFFKKSLPLTEPDYFFLKLEKYIKDHPHKEEFPKGLF